jgi:hypothetical protein
MFGVVVRLRAAALFLAAAPGSSDTINDEAGNVDFSAGVMGIAFAISHNVGFGTKAIPARIELLRFLIPKRTPVAQESSPAFFTGWSKLRLRHFDLCWLRGLLFDSCCRAVRSTTGRYDRHSSSSASGMEVAADPEYVPRQVCPTNRQRAQAARERSNRKLCRRQGRRAFSDGKPFVFPFNPPAWRNNL